MLPRPLATRAFLAPVAFLVGALACTSSRSTAPSSRVDDNPHDTGAPDIVDTSADDSTDVADSATTDSGADDTGADSSCPPGPWRVANGFVCNDGARAAPFGANGMHVFGPGSSDITAWRLTLAREFIGNMRDVPLEGWAIQDPNGSWLHPLRNVVDDNRANGLVTILSPMGWDGVDALLGDEPSEAPYRGAYDVRLADLARTFAGERDVWISVWNEPYAWTGEGFDPETWRADMQSLVDVVRATGNDSIVVVPGSHMGQGTDVWLTHAAQLTDPADALVFDLHAYERWLLDRNTAAAQDALRALDDAGIPWMVGEIAPMNAGTLMDPRAFLALPEVARRPVTAWLWKRSDTDLDALLDSAGNPNDRDNHAWGSTVRALAAER